MLKPNYPRRIEKYFQNLALTTSQSAPRILGGGKHMAMSTKRTNNKTLHIVTYNTRSLSTDERLMELEGELEHIKWDVVGLSEVKRGGEQLLDLKSGHIFYNVDEEESSWGGVGFLIHKRHKSSIVSLNKISTRVISLILKLNTRYNIKLI